MNSTSLSNKNRRQTSGPLSNDLNPSIDVYPIFKCDCVDTKNEKYGEVLQKLFDELETYVAITLLTYPTRPQKASIHIPFLLQQLSHLKAK
ncbi:unnamed protein product [Rhizophagus irregularis]|nr:unnamed protein product [Rhizophagus irregularis]